jgi:hypothetical protein
MKGPTYTPVSRVKKVFKPWERSLSRQEVAHRLLTLQENSDMDPERCIDIALETVDSPFSEGSSKAIIEFLQESTPLAGHVHRLLKGLASPLTEEQILRKLRGMNLISWSFSFGRLGLMSDHRFAQFEEDDRWFLSEWEIINDQLFELLRGEGKKECLTRDIPYLIKVKLNLPRHNHLFIPELDERFIQNGDKLRLVYQEAETPNFFPEKRELTAGEEAVKEEIGMEAKIGKEILTNSYLEVAVTMNQQTVEFEKQNGERTVVDAVVEDLMGALIKLEKRDSEMKEEVLQHFSSNNLDAISSLLAEKTKNEKVLGKLKDIIDELA